MRRTVRSYEWERVTAAAVAAALVLGCAAHRVRFTSEPDGVAVRVAGEEYRTPCLVTVPDGVEEVGIVSPAGELVTVEIPAPGTVWDRTGSMEGKGCAYVLYGISVPCMVVGAVGVAWLNSMQDGTGWEYALEGGNVYQVIILGGSAVAYVVGLPMYSAAEYLDEASDLEDPTVHVIFPAALRIQGKTPAPGEDAPSVPPP
ncbi:MAG TPA: hypothetical protein PK636_04920 [bacterium]|nr:hypothetical protein [bacterium]